MADNTPEMCARCNVAVNGINGRHCLHEKVRRSVTQDGVNAVPACKRTVKSER